MFHAISRLGPNLKIPILHGKIFIYYVNSRCINLSHTLQVSENGVISFGTTWTFSHPQIFPTSNYYIQQSSVVAPFWSDNDIRKEGTVRYVAITEGASTQENELLAEVNTFLQEMENIQDFVGTWMLVAQWEKVHPHPHGADDHEGIPEEFLNKVIKSFVGN